MDTGIADGRLTLLYTYPSQTETTNFFNHNHLPYNRFPPIQPRVGLFPAAVGNFPPADGPSCLRLDGPNRPSNFTRAATRFEFWERNVGGHLRLGKWAGGWAGGQVGDWAGGRAAKWPNPIHAAAQWQCASSIKTISSTLEGNCWIPYLILY